MIYLGLSLRNPFVNHGGTNISCVSKLITKHKAIEFEVIRDKQLLVSFGIDVNIRTDHSGFDLSVGLLTYSLGFRFYDIRHWNWAGHEEAYED